MKILIGMMHPKQVHMFKYFIREMENRGHQLLSVVIEKDIMNTLLDNLGINYVSLGKNPPTIIQKVLSTSLWTYKTAKIATQLKPDMYIGRAFPHFALSKQITHGDYIILEDSEPARMLHLATFPFADVILTPSTYRLNHGGKHIRVDSYNELMYLHPNYFEPDWKIVKNVGVSKGEEYVILRFVAWTAHHDIGREGFTLKEKIQLAKKLNEYSTVFITSESPLPKELEKYRLPIPPQHIHHFLYYANLLVCDSQTMTTEAGVLGTPAIRSNSFVGLRDMGNFIELEKRYGLIYNIREPEKAIKKAIELIKQPNLKKIWERKRKRLLNDKIDLTSFMVWFVENYPDSFREFKENPEIQYRFR